VFSGTLTYPDDVATTYPISVATGRVRAMLTVVGTSSLGLVVECVGGSRRVTGTSSVTVLVEASSGSCRITVRDDDPSSSPIAYVLHVRFPIASPERP
jgi:hypothetical protein